MVKLGVSVRILPCRARGSGPKSVEIRVFFALNL